jgi:hypothetical protein
MHFSDVLETNKEKRGIQIKKENNLQVSSVLLKLSTPKSQWRIKWDVL